MPNIIDILPGAIQQGLSLQEKKKKKPNGAARPLKENKESQEYLRTI